MRERNTRRSSLRALAGGVAFVRFGPLALADIIRRTVKIHISSTT
jgi:hypothetical protein